MPIDFNSQFVMTIGGKAATSAETFAVINPATSEPIAWRTASWARSNTQPMRRERLDEF